MLRLGTQPSRLGQRPADLPKLPTKSEPSAAGASTVLRVSFRVFLSPFPPSHSRSPLPGGGSQTCETARYNLCVCEGIRCAPRASCRRPVEASKRPAATMIMRVPGHVRCASRQRNVTRSRRHHTRSRPSVAHAVVELSAIPPARARSPSPANRLHRATCARSHVFTRDSFAQQNSLDEIRASSAGMWPQMRCPRPHARARRPSLLANGRVALSAGQHACGCHSTHSHACWRMPQ